MSKLSTHWSKFHGLFSGIPLIAVIRQIELQQLRGLIDVVVFEVVVILIYHFEQESRIHQENIVKMHLLRRAIRWHYKLKRCALILNGKDVLTHRHRLLLFMELM